MLGKEPEAVLDSHEPKTTAETVLPGDTIFYLCYFSILTEKKWSHEYKYGLKLDYYIPFPGYLH